MNLLFGAVFLICTVSQWSCGLKPKETFEPIKVFSFQTSKFQVEDVIDSIVENDTALSFQALTDYIDTFIFERSFCLKILNNPDSVKYFYYFSGDAKEWLMSTDSALLIFSYVSINGKTYNAESIKRTESERIQAVLNFFDQHIISQVTESLKNLPHYDIRIIDSQQVGNFGGIGVVCKQKGECDTLVLKYIDGGKYTATPYFSERL